MRFTGRGHQLCTPSGAWGLTEDMAVQNTYKILVLYVGGLAENIPSPRGTSFLGSSMVASTSIAPPTGPPSVSCLLRHPESGLRLRRQLEHRWCSPRARCYGARSARSAPPNSANGAFVGRHQRPGHGDHYTYGFSKPSTSPSPRASTSSASPRVLQGQYNLGRAGPLPTRP